MSHGARDGPLTSGRLSPLGPLWRLAHAGLYGPGWFALLARRRWEKITAEELAEVFALLLGKGRS